MVKSKLWLVASAGVLTIALACQVDRSTAPIILAPVRVSKIAAPPGPQTYTLSSQSGSSVELTGNNYPYNAWITVVPNGPKFMLTAYPPAQPPTGLVGATGAAGGRNGCDLNAVLMSGGVSTGFGPCGGTVGTDTVLAKQQWFIRQGSMPLDYAEIDCPPHPGTCHTQEIVNTTFTVSPIPALMVPVKASPRTVQFNSVQYQAVTFTTGANPAEIFVGGRLNGIPVTPTSWVYTAGDGTLDGNMCSGGYPYYPCSPYLHKAGRMVVKAFIAGWEQTSSVTVQCLMTPTDQFLNDSTNDFQFRATLLDALALSNPDSLPGVGATAQHAGFRHEEAGIVWHLPDGSYMFTRTNDPEATECHSNSLAGRAAGAAWPPPPVQGAYPVTTYHVHPSIPGDDVYGCSSLDNNHPMSSQYPGDHLKPQVAGNFKKAGGGSGAHLFPADTTGDWPIVEKQGTSMYIIEKDGIVWRLDPDFGFPKKNNPNHWSAFGNAFDPNQPAGKCTWPKTYNPT